MLREKEILEREILEIDRKRDLIERMKEIDKERERQIKGEKEKKGRRHISTEIYKRYHLRNKDISICQFNLNFLLLQSLYFCKIIRLDKF